MIISLTQRVSLISEVILLREHPVAAVGLQQAEPRIARVARSRCENGTESGATRTELANSKLFSSLDSLSLSLRSCSSDFSPRYSPEKLYRDPKHGRWTTESERERERE